MPLARLCVAIALVTLSSSPTLADQRDPEAIKKQAFEWLQEKTTVFGNTEAMMPPRRPGGAPISGGDKSRVLSLDNCILTVENGYSVAGDPEAGSTTQVAIPMVSVIVSAVHVKSQAAAIAALGGTTNAVQVMIPTKSGNNDARFLMFNSSEIAERAVHAIIDLAIACGAEDKEEAY